MGLSEVWGCAPENSCLVSLQLHVGRRWAVEEAESRPAQDTHVLTLEPLTVEPHVQRFRGKWYSADLKRDNIPDYWVGCVLTRVLDWGWVGGPGNGQRPNFTVTKVEQRPRRRSGNPSPRRNAGQWFLRRAPKMRQFRRHLILGNSSPPPGNLRTLALTTGGWILHFRIITSIPGQILQHYQINHGLSYCCPRTSLHSADKICVVDYSKIVWFRSFILYYKYFFHCPVFHNYQCCSTFYKIDFFWASISFQYN